MIRVLRTLTLALASFALLAACADSPAEPGSAPSIGGPQAAATSLDRFSEIQEMEFFEFVPCANGGAGELVLGSGRVRFAGQLLQDGNGGLHIRYNANPQGFAAVGEATGDTYRVTGSAQETRYLGPDLPEIVRFRSKLQAVATGGGARFRMEFVGKLVVSANGEIRVGEIEDSITCD